MWRRSCAAHRAYEAEGTQVAVQSFARETLREDVCRVLIPADFVEFEVPSAQTFLYPELSHCGVPYSANAASPADAYCCGGFGMHPDLHLEPEVSPPCLDPKSLCGVFYKAMEFCLG